VSDQAGPLMPPKGSSAGAAALVETAPRSRRPARGKAPAALRGPTASLRDQAYEAIKRRIITLDYAPGEHLNEAAISEALGIGRTPVHQALDRLMLEGMIDIIPRKCVIVRPISLDEHLQLTQVRLINEPYCASLAAERADADEIEAMRALLDRAHGRMEARDVAGLMDLDRDFHASISRASGSSRSPTPTTTGASSASTRRSTAPSATAIPSAPPKPPAPTSSPRATTS
jgi:hypothetical protein